MNESIVKLNKCVTDLYNWSGIDDFDMFVEVYSPCKIGIQVSVDEVIDRCETVYLYERQLNRFEFLQLVLKDRSKEDWSMTQSIKKLSSPGQFYWQEDVGVETTVFGISKEGVKMFALFYSCNEDIDYVKEYSDYMIEYEKKREFDELSDKAYVINIWLSDKHVIESIKLLIRISHFPNPLRDSCFIIWGPKIASAFSIEMSSVYLMLMRLNKVTITSILETKFGNTAMDCLLAGLIDKCSLTLFS